MSTLGIEIEYTDLRVQDIKEFYNYLGNIGWEIVHDASVESPCYYLGKPRLPIKGCTYDHEINKAILREFTIGGELVSPILDSTKDSTYEQVDKILYFLKKYGERENTSRGSIHIHVGFPGDVSSSNNINRFSPQLLRRTWKLAGFLENFFFKVGGMGKEHRGKNMDYIYYRPITGNGPHVINNRGNYYPALIFDDILNIRRADEFFVRCADILHAGGRYHPCRYLWINFYNLMYCSKGRSHLEFRVFNKSLRMDYIYAIIKLCTSFVDTVINSTEESINKSTKNRIVSLDEDTDITYALDSLQALGLDVNSAESSILIEMFEKSPELEYEDVRVFSHLNDRGRIFDNPEFMEYYPNSLTKEEQLKVRKPNYIDIHKLKNMNQKVFPEDFE